jgi:hypothetical protein
MYSRDHALLSLAVAGAAVFVLDLPIGWPVAVALALVAGVGIDFDHFLVARVTTGEWRALRRCLANPRLVVLEQDEIFAPDAITELQRLLSHVLVIGVVVPVAAVVDPALAVFVAAVLYVHLLADLVWDNYRSSQGAAGQPTGAD